MKQNEFKVGDMVYCVEPRDNLKYEQLYQIIDVGDTVVNVEGMTPAYYADRFKLAIPDNKLNRVLYPDFKAINGWLVEQRENYD